MTKLFCYGTLQSVLTQNNILGHNMKLLDTSVLEGYILGQLETEGAWYPCIYEYATGQVHGTVYEVTDEELAILDEYEGKDYKRINVGDYQVYLKA